MKLNVPKLSQRDSRWSAQRLGTVNSTTIGSHGCLVCCMCMLAQYYGHQIIPSQMDDWLTDNQGYAQGNMYRNDAFHREFVDCNYVRTVYCTDIPAPLNQIDDALKAGYPVVVMVDFDHDPKNGVQTHFVVITGKTEDGSYIINDPWFGDEVFMQARYGPADKAINQINFFVGPVPQKPAPTTPINTTAPGVPDTSAASDQGVASPTWPDLRDKVRDLETALVGLQKELDDDDKLMDEANRSIEQLTKSAQTGATALQMIKDITYGSGWPWTKINKIKTILPK